MSIIITDADLAALARYPLSLQEAARALWSGGDILPGHHTSGKASAKNQTRHKIR